MNILEAMAASTETFSDMAGETRTTLSRLRDRCDKVTRPVRHLWEWMGDARRGITSFVQRGTRGYSDDELWNLGASEVRRMAGMLEKLYLESHSYAAGYGDRRQWLKHRDDTDEQLEEWLDSPARTPLWEFVDVDEDDGTDGMSSASVKKRRNRPRLSRSKTVREAGPDRCAWFEDLNYVTEVLKEWVEWHDGMTYRFIRCSEIYGHEEAHRQQQAIDAKFQEAWTWIGRNASALWD